MPATDRLKSLARRPASLARLSSLDAEFLHIEDDASPMHIAGLCTFEGPVPSREEVLRLVAAKLPRLPRYRQVLRVPPLELGRPVWVDDPRFKLAYHVRRMALPAPHDAAALDALMGRLMAMRLDRDRPLWEVYVVEGVEGDRWALISKTHHAMVDGIAGSTLMVTLLDEAADAPVPEVAPWSPAPPPSGLAMVRDAFAGFREDNRILYRGIFQGLRRPEEGMRAARELSVGMGNLWKNVLTTTSGPLQGTIGKHRAYAHTSVPLADVQRIRKSLFGTVNDVVLTAVAGGYRALLVQRALDPDREVMRSLVPVSVRAAEAHGVPDNQVSFILCDLAVNVRDPVERMAAIHAEMKRLKASRMAEAGALLNTLGDLAFPPVQGAVTRAVARLMHRYPPRSHGTVTTNVPGPRKPLYLLGRRMLDWYPYVPITQGLRVGAAILSYAGQLGFGLTADYDSVPDVAHIASGIDATLAELLGRAHAHPTAAQGAHRAT